MACNEQQVTEAVETKMGPGGVPEGSKTSEFYRTENIPTRFDNPDWFQGYGGKQQHPMYRTTSALYGAKPPSVHTMTTSFYCRSQKFSEHLGKCGMYRNHSLNTDLDNSRV
ncbi:piercer of microtubule wall 1 protein-like [Argopecten irradians]|uniref:piercer of microtubule wall 1 protein-like n=1 Tax=Argopecten irradians TaxID=31199 RepID=UPI0037247A42